MTIPLVSVRKCIFVLGDIAKNTTGLTTQPCWGFINTFPSSIPHKPF